MLAPVARISMLPAAHEENFFYLAVILWFRDGLDVTGWALLSAAMLGAGETAAGVVYSVVAASPRAHAAP